VKSSVEEKFAAVAAANVFCAGLPTVNPLVVFLFTRRISS